MLKGRRAADGKFPSFDLHIVEVNRRNIHQAGGRPQLAGDEVKSARHGNGDLPVILPQLLESVAKRGGVVVFLNVGEHLISLR